MHYSYAQIVPISNQVEKNDNLSSNTYLQTEPQTLNETENNKVVVLSFDDSYKSQFTYAKPILDKYGFKATFFEVCDWIGSGSEENEKMTWSDIAELHSEGHDIQSHTMTHPHLNKLSPSELEYEIGQSKQCLLDHGINSTIFAYPYGEGWDNPEVSDIVSRHYDLARTDNKTPLTPLKGNYLSDHYFYAYSGSKNYLYNYTFPDRHPAINSWSHRHIEGDYSTAARECEGSCAYYNSSQMLEKFINLVNSQESYNTHQGIGAIPIVVYHTIVTYPDLRDSERPVDITVDLFEKEMKYLHDNNFKVLRMSDLA